MFGILEEFDGQEIVNFVPLKISQETISNIYLGTLEGCGLEGSESSEALLKPSKRELMLRWLGDALAAGILLVCLKRSCRYS